MLLILLLLLLLQGLMYDCNYRTDYMMFKLHWRLQPESMASFCNAFLCPLTTTCCLDNVLNLITMATSSPTCWWWEMDRLCFTRVIAWSPCWFVLIVSIHVNFRTRWKCLLKTVSLLHYLQGHQNFIFVRSLCFLIDYVKSSLQCSRWKGTFNFPQTLYTAHSFVLSKLKSVHIIITLCALIMHNF